MTLKELAELILRLDAEEGLSPESLANLQRMAKSATSWAKFADKPPTDFDTNIVVWGPAFPLRITTTEELLEKDLVADGATHWMALLELPRWRGRKIGYR